MFHCLLHCRTIGMAFCVTTKRISFDSFLLGKAQAVTTVLKFTTSLANFAILLWPCSKELAAHCSSLMPKKKVNCLQQCSNTGLLLGSGSNSRMVPLALTTLSSDATINTQSGFSWPSHVCSVTQCSQLGFLTFFMFANQKNSFLFDSWSTG